MLMTRPSTPVFASQQYSVMTTFLQTALCVCNICPRRARFFSWRAHYETTLCQDGRRHNGIVNAFALQSVTLCLCTVLPIMWHACFRDITTCCMCRKTKAFLIRYLNWDIVFIVSLWHKLLKRIFAYTAHVKVLRMLAVWCFYLVLVLRIDVLVLVLRTATLLRNITANGFGAL